MKVAEVKETYKPGTRIRLKKINGDWICPQSGDEGTVSAVDDVGTIHIDWDNGFRIGLIPDVDEFEVIERSEK